MEKDKIIERRDGLIKGLNQLNIKLEEVAQAIDMQKGAIEECNFWLKGLEENKEVKEPEAKIAEEPSEKSETKKVIPM